MSCPEGKNSVIRRTLLAQHIISERSVYLLSQFTWEQFIEWEKCTSLQSSLTGNENIFRTNWEW